MKKSQLNALKDLVSMAKDGTGLSKGIVRFLIDRSEGLTREVCLTLTEDPRGYTRDEIGRAAYGVENMVVQSGTTHLREILHAMGSDFTVNLHYGDFDPTRSDDPFSSAGQFAGLKREQVSSDDAIREGMPFRYTFWLSKEHYSRKAQLVVPTREDLEKKKKK